MTGSEREMGEFAQRLKQLEHRYRNDRQANLLLEAEVNDLRNDLDRLRSRIYAVMSSIAIFAGIIGWTLEFLVS